MTDALLALADAPKHLTLASLHITATRRAAVSGPKRTNIEAEIEDYTRYGGEETHVVLADIANNRGAPFTVQRFVRAQPATGIVLEHDLVEYELIDNLDNGKIAGEAGIKFNADELVIDIVSITQSYQGAGLCVPFVTLALRDVLARLAAPPPYVRVGVETEQPAAAIACYKKAVQAVGYDPRYEVVEADYPEIVCPDEDDHSSESVEYADTVEKYEDALERGFVTEPWRETLVFHRAALTQAHGPGAAAAAQRRARARH